MKTYLLIILMAYLNVSVLYVAGVTGVGVEGSWFLIFLVSSAFTYSFSKIIDGV